MTTIALSNYHMLILLPVSSITWLENDVFMMVHSPSNFDPNQAPTSTFHLVTRRPKSTEYVYQKLGDPAPNFGLNRSPPHHFLLRLTDFPPNLKDLIIVASTASTDIGLFTRSTVPLVSDKPADQITGVFTMTEMSDDSRRAQLPVNDTMDDTSPIGAVLDLSSRQKVPKPIPGDEMDESQTPLPALLVLNNEGILASWWLVYSESIRQGTSYPGLVGTSGGQHITPATPVSAFHNQPRKPAFGQSSFSSSQSIGTTFGSPSQPATTFGIASASTPTRVSAFGAQSNLNNKPSVWGSPAVNTAAPTGATIGAPTFGSSSTPAFGGPAFGASTFGTPSFGRPAAPATASAAFGSSALPGSRPSPWSAAGSSAPPATSFGQPSNLGTAASSSLDIKPSSSIFGPGSSMAPTTGGFASFANKGGFAAVSASQGRNENIFASKLDSTAFPSKSNVADSGSSFGGIGSSTMGQPQGLFDSRGFTLASTFKPDVSSKDDTSMPVSGGSSSFFGSGFGKVLGEAQTSPVIATPEANMEDDVEVVQNSSSMPTVTTISPITSTGEDQKQPSATASPIARPKFQFQSVQPSSNLFGVSKSTDTTSPFLSTTKSAGFSFGAVPPLAETNAKDGILKTLTGFPAHAPSQVVDIKPEPQFSDGRAQNLFRIPEAPFPPDIISKKSFAIGELSTSSEEPDAPLPPDFIDAPKSRMMEELDISNSIKISSVNADLIPPLDVPLSPADDHSADSTDQGYGEYEEGSGEDITKDISPVRGNTPDMTPESSFGISIYGDRGDKAFAKGLQIGQEPSSRSLFGEIGGRNPPVLAAPKRGSPRSPSPVRSSIPARLLGRPEVTRSVSAPTAASKLLGIRTAPMSSSTFSQTLQYSQKEERRREDELKQKVIDESQALVDEDDERTHEFLNGDIEGTTRLDEFVAHQDYVGNADKDSVPFQVEAVYRDINSMIDTLGVNSRTLKCFVKGHTEQYKDPGRERTDLEGSDEWCLGEIGNLASIIEKDLARDLEQGRIKDSFGKLELCSELAKDVTKLRFRKEEISAVLSSNRDPDHAALNRSQPLTAEEAIQQHDLRRDFASFQKLLGDAEEELILLRTKLASLGGSDGRVSGGPTVEAVMRTVMKMTAMAEKRSGDVDVLENQMRRLRFSSAASRDEGSHEDSPFGSPAKLNMRHTAIPSTYGRPYTPDGSRNHPRALHTSLSSSIRSPSHPTPPRKKLGWFTDEDKSRIKEAMSRKKEVTNRLKSILEKSGTTIRPMEEA